MLARCFLLLCAFCVTARADDAVDVRQQRIRLAMVAEPANLNSMMTTDPSFSGFILAHVMEGLLQYDEHGALAPGVAERWELRADGATFWLRRDARWSDGKPVTARDFVFAWRQIVTPATASRYANVLYPIKNAERVRRGDLPPTALGAHAVDDYRLEVEFERPCPYFLGLTAYFVYSPVREDFYRDQGERYASEPGAMLYNGAFVLSRWVHGARLTLRRNPYYWDRQHVFLNEIDIPYITGDSSAAFNLFKAGNIALSVLENENLDDALANGFTIRPHRTGALFYLEFNQRPGRSTANRHLRQAMQALFDPASMADKVVAIPGVLPTVSVFAHSVNGLEKPFQEEYPPPQPRRGLQLARDHLARARAELGVATLPPLILLTRDDARAAKEAEYLQQLLAAGLGLDLRIDRQMTHQRYEKMARGEFDIVVTGWGPDFDDPITFGDVFASWNENNRGRYYNPRYDRLVDIAHRSADPRERMRAMAQMQRLLIEDVPVLPLYENSRVYVQHPQLRGIARNVFGVDPDLRHARVVAPDPG